MRSRVRGRVQPEVAARRPWPRPGGGGEDANPAPRRATRRLGLWAGLGVAALLVTSTPAAAAPVQVSDAFVRAAREVTSMFTRSLLEKACATPPVTSAAAPSVPSASPASATCKGVATAVADLVARLPDASSDPEALDAALRRLTGALLRAGLGAVLDQELPTLLATSGVATTAASPPDWSALPFGSPPQGSAPPLTGAAPADADPGVAYARDLLDHLRTLLVADDVRTGSAAIERLLVEQSEHTREATNPGRRPTLYADRFLDPLHTELVGGGCGSDVLAPLDDWRAARWSVLADVRAQMAGGAAADLRVLRTLAAIAPGTCSATAAEEVAALRESAAVLAVDFAVAGAASRWRAPARGLETLLALLESGERTPTDAQLAALGLDGFAAVLGAADARLVECSAATGCRVLDRAGTAGEVLYPPGATFDPWIALNVVSPRADRGAAEATCEWQALSLLWTGSAPALGVHDLEGGLADPAGIRTGAGLCRPAAPAATPSPALDGWLDPVGPGVYRWKGVRALDGTRWTASAVPDLRTLPFGRLVEGFPGVGEVVGGDRETWTRLGSALARGDEAAAGRAGLGVAVDALQAPLSALLDRELTPLSACSAAGPFRARCAVRVLVEAAWRPALDALIDPHGSEWRAELAAVLTRLDELDLLGRSPLWITVGPAVTATGPGVGGTADDWRLHLTLLDRYGVAIRDRRGHLEAGAFVGGFVDAVTRTDGDNDEPSWLVGAGIGVRRFSPDVPVGLQLWGGAAIPVETGGNAVVRPAVGLQVSAPLELLLAEGSP